VSVEILQSEPPVLASFEFPIPFLLSADVLPSRWNSKADNGVHGQENDTDRPSKFDIERERFCEHPPTPFPNCQQLSADGRQQEPCMLSHPDRFPWVVDVLV